MICHELSAIANGNPGFSMAGLRYGNEVDEFRNRPDCQLASGNVNSIHNGKEAYLAGGYTDLATKPTPFVLGYEQERRDWNALSHIK